MPETRSNRDQFFSLACRIIKRLRSHWIFHGASSPKSVSDRISIREREARMQAAFLMEDARPEHLVDRRRVKISRAFSSKALARRLRSFKAKRTRVGNALEVELTSSGLLYVIYTRTMRISSTQYN